MMKVLRGEYSDARGRPPLLDRAEAIRAPGHETLAAAISAKETTVVFVPASLFERRAAGVLTTTLAQ